MKSILISILHDVTEFTAIEYVLYCAGTCLFIASANASIGIS